MANTEGMSDEFVASLMTTAVSGTTSKDKKPTAKDPKVIGAGMPDIVERRQKPQINRRRRKGAPIMSAVTNQRLQERLNMPMPEGGQPSAQVIRSSQSSNATATTTRQPQRISTSHIPQPQQENGSSGGAANTPAMLPPSIVGEVFEHSLSPMERKTSRFQRKRKQKQSRFAQQNLGSNGNAGFPSVHMPIGTFVSKPKQQRGGKPTKVSKPPSTTTPPVVTKSQSDRESMQHASTRDASNMLAQMSMEEIQSHQQDLEAALSPNIKAFLKMRSQQKKKQEEQQQEPVVDEQDATPPSSTETQIETKRIETNPQQEKERLALLMSSVRTHQDLDRAYHQEMQQAHPLEHDTSLGSVAGEETTNAARLPNDSSSSSSDPGTDKDFDMACDLLRSSVKRQTLWAAKLVSQSLSERVLELQQEKLGPRRAPSNKTVTTKRRKNWPLLLPISLRCLMDEPIHGQGILHTYVLQALYSLLLLNAVDDHLVWVDSSRTAGFTSDGDINGDDQPGERTATSRELSSSPLSEKEMYQHIFMDDAIPTPPLDTAYPSNTVQPLTVDNIKSSKSVAAYSTSSSSTSAMEDAKAFEKDPMWTLLSKMRIIPRLTQLLCPKNDALMLPEEAWIASCGILAMLGQRSPGAASAIVHQKPMFSQLLDRCLMRYSLERQQPEHQPEQTALLEQVAFACMQLLVNLTRQSRTTAKAMAPHMEEVLPALLLPSDNLSVLELRIQKMGIILWRTLLRYGLGLPGFATMLKMAAHHWALPHTNPLSLSIEYLSAFTQVLKCARVAQSKTTAPDKAKKKPIIDEDTMRILSMVPTHLGATQRQLLPSAPASDSNPSSMTIQSADICHKFQWMAARLSFLSSYWSLASNTSQSTANQEVKVEEISMEDELAFLETLDVWTDPGGVLEAAWKLAWQQESEQVEDLLIGAPEEASASAFLSSFANTLIEMDMSRSNHKNRMVQQLTKAVVKHFVERIIEGCKRTRLLSGNEKVDPPRSTLPRQGWRNHCYFAVAKLLFHAHSIGVLTSSSDINQARMLAFSLIANLERGQEAVAAVLLSQDVLFMPNGNPLHDSSSESSPISTLFLGEICGSEMARKQLDHSFKLQNGFGLTAEGYGPFALDSLLSATDRMGPKMNGELILPLGNLWLLQTLSGSIQMKQQTIDKGTDEAVRVLSTALGLLLELEEAEEIDATCRWYSPSIPVGAKMYYLLNVCLHPETILRDERIAEASGALFEKYCSQLNDTSLYELSQACLHHTEPAKKEVVDPEADQSTEEKDKVLLDKLLNPNMETNTALSPAAMRSLEALLEDVVTAYRDYGAQYSFFTKCVRLFLAPVYPSSIRCRTMQELRGMLHLLTLPDDSKSDEDLLEIFLSGGLPEPDSSTKDASSVLDALVVAVTKESSSRELDGFFLHFAVATLGRNLASSISDETGSLSMKRRLSQIPSRVSSFACDVASTILKEKGSKKDIAVVTVKVCAEGKVDDNFDLASRIASLGEGQEI